MGGQLPEMAVVLHLDTDKLSQVSHVFKIDV